MAKKEKNQKTSTAAKFFTFGIFDDDYKPVKVYAGAVMTFKQAWKRCEVLQLKHSTPQILFC
jgi:hypothetical protein